MQCFNQKLRNNQQNNSIVGRGNPDVWYNKFDESTKRQYFEIQDYKVQVPGEESANEQAFDEKRQREHLRIKEIMKTEKKSICAGDCC